MDQNMLSQPALVSQYLSERHEEAATVRMRMRSHLLLLSLLSGDSLARYRDRNVFYIKPAPGSSLPSALVHNNYPVHPSEDSEVEYQAILSLS